MENFTKGNLRHLGKYRNKMDQSGSLDTGVMVL